MIDIKPIENYEETAVLALYRSVGWSAYFRQPEILRRAFMNSLCAFGAYDGEALVGLVRVVGDGETIVFIQDILVKPRYQRQGIGRRLIAKVLEKFETVRQIHLLTDDLPETVGFYESVGFTSVEKIHARAFTRLKY